MSVWLDSLLTAIYTLGPVHCGTGQTTGAVDLPIARDVTTGLPVLPATMLKGVAREAFEKRAKGVKGEEKLIKELFGPELDDADTSLCAGALSLTEGRLLAYPIRSLNRPYLHVTCPLLLERFRRDLRALGLGDFLPRDLDLTGWESRRAYASSQELSGQALVLEDLVYQADEVFFSADLRKLAEQLAVLFPAGEEDSAKRLREGLVLIPDDEFQDAVNRAIPARARIVLTGGKTTSKWINEEGKTETGNLWYEEFLPSDCLFVSFVGQRRQRVFREREGGDSQETRSAMGDFRERFDWLDVVQIGGNETVGHGICAWTAWRKEDPRS